jgi:hypothetical protein
VRGWWWRWRRRRRRRYRMKDGGGTGSNLALDALEHTDKESDVLTR